MRKPFFETSNHRFLHRVVGIALAVGILIPADGAGAKGASAPLTTATAASRESVIHCFGCVPDGSSPSSNLAEDAEGNFYGLAYGGLYGQGMVYKLTQPTSENPTETFTPIYNFESLGPYTVSGGLQVTPNGTVVGSTYLTASVDSPTAEGTVFELTPPAVGKTEWTQETLLDFGKGVTPTIVGQDSNGIIYGTVYVGNAEHPNHARQRLFTLTPPKGVKTTWTFHSLRGLYDKPGDGDYVAFAIPDGSGGAYAVDEESLGSGMSLVHLTPTGPTSIYPADYEPVYGNYSLALGPQGTLYYAPPSSPNSPTLVTQIFQLTPPSSGKTWTRKLVYTFPGNDVSLVSAPNGALYANVTPTNTSSIFSISPPANGKTKWTVSRLSDFGQNTTAFITVGPGGAIYGISAGGGLAYTPASLFKLSPNSSGTSLWNNQTLYTFTGNDGFPTASSVLASSSGALYETTQSGGTYDGGTVVQLVPPADGEVTWTENVLYSFGISSNSSYPNGRVPNGPVISDATGALYGTTIAGGPSDNGVVFKLTPPSTNETVWTEAVISDFSTEDFGPSSAAFPPSGLVMDPSGALYGTTFKGGERRYGRVYELTPPQAGQTAWIQTTLYEFDASNVGPCNPLLLDANGNLFGTTIGSSSINGSVFELSPPAAGETTWHETLVHRFTSATGKPVGGVIAGTDGTLYVPTSSALVQLTPPSVGQTVWTATKLYDFPNERAPQAGLVMTNGNFYGAAIGGPKGFGSIFNLHQSESGKWTATNLYDFTGGNDGSLPNTSLTLGHDGALYGAASAGGYSGKGVVFRIIP